MSKEILILGLIIGLAAPVFTADSNSAENTAAWCCISNAEGEIPAASTIRTRKHAPPPPSTYSSSRFWPFSRRNYGTITGYTPPIGQTNTDIYSSSTGWWSTPWNTNSSVWNNSLWGNNINGGYYGNPPRVNNTVGSRLKRFFNPNYSNHYQNSPGYNPYMNGNYSNNLQNSRYIPLYNGGNSMNGYQNRNGLNFDTNTNSTGGATVKIID